MARSTEELTARMGDLLGVTRKKIRKTRQTPRAHLLRYIIEVKDEHGWMDYSAHTNLDVAKREVVELRKGFPEIKLIDTENMLEVEV